MKRVCPNCHYPNDAGALYCASCQDDISSVLPTEQGRPAYTSPNSSGMPMSPINASPNSAYASAPDNSISIGAWLGILIGLSIPIVGFIILIYMWISSDNETLKSFAKAQFIVILIAFVIGILIMLMGV